MVCKACTDSGYICRDGPSIVRIGMLWSIVTSYFGRAESCGPPVARSPVTRQLRTDGPSLRLHLLLSPLPQQLIDRLERLGPAPDFSPFWFVRREQDLGALPSVWCPVLDRFDILATREGYLIGIRLDAHYQGAASSSRWLGA